MKKINPKVSIIIPVYNGSNYLKDAIDSALAQTYKNLEILVINDGSNDDGKTREIALSYKDKIRYFEKENGGASSAINLGIKEMKGEYFSWLSHDDMYYPNKVERQVEEILKYDKKTILLSNYDYINPQGEKIQSVYLDHKMMEEKPDYAVLRSQIGGITLLIPKEAFEIHGEFSLEQRCTQDYYMWFRFLKDYKFVHMKDILAMTRIHSMQDSVTSPRMLVEGNELWTYMSKEYPLERKIATEGSEYTFYKEMENYLKTTPYRIAAKDVEMLAEKSLENNRKDLKDTTITVIIIDNKNEADLNKTISSIKEQSHKKYEIVVEKDIKERNNILKKIKTNYHTFINAGQEVIDTWLEDRLLTALASAKALTISDLNRTNKNNVLDNKTSLFITLDGVIFDSKYKIEYKNLYQYLYDHYKQNGSIITEKKYFNNLERKYDMQETFKFYGKLINEEEMTPFEMACISYDLTCLYNHNFTLGNPVYMYEPCNQLKDLMYSRSFKLLKSYIDKKHARKQARREEGKK